MALLPGEPLSTVNARYVEPSNQRILKHNEKIAHLYTLNTTTPYFVQRLSERAYFFGGGFYTTTFYIGDKGVLVFDPPENQSKNLLEAIAALTPWPVTAIAISHNHADHFIGTQDLLDAAKAAGVSQVRILASTATKEKMEFTKCTLPAPNELLQWPKDSFKFEALTVELHGFVRASHTDDAAAFLLVEEKVCHIVDLMNGDQPPFMKFGVAAHAFYYRHNINEIGALDWVHFVGGHGNIGSREDIKFLNVFLDDLDVAVKKSMARLKFSETGLDKEVDHASLMVPWMAGVSAAATDDMRPKYGKYYAFERTLPSNAELILLDLVSYR